MSLVTIDGVIISTDEKTNNDVSNVVLRATILLKSDLSDENKLQLLNYFTAILTDVKIVRNTLQFSGTTSQLNILFNNTYAQYIAIPGNPTSLYVAAATEAKVPQYIADLIIFIGDLSNKPILAPKCKWALPADATEKKTFHNLKFGAEASPQSEDVQANPLFGGDVAPNSFRATTLANLYSFPASTGSGQKVAILQFGGGYQLSDFTAYFTFLGLTTPSFTATFLDGTFNNFNAGDGGASFEVELDFEVVGAVAPGATYRFIFAANSTSGFMNAFTEVANDPAIKVISLSWAFNEQTGNAGLQAVFNNISENFIRPLVENQKATLFTASGDTGALVGAVIETLFPSSSPWSTTTGGTTIDAVVGTNTITSEIMWKSISGTSSSGGGRTSYFLKPPYQANEAHATDPQIAATTQRGYPDLASACDPERSGFFVIFDSTQFVGGGTSASAPFMAGMMTRILAITGIPYGLLNTGLYEAYYSFGAYRDITVGDNNGYIATPLFDNCTGLGAPVGNKILEICATIQLERLRSRKVSAPNSIYTAVAPFLDTSNMNPGNPIPPDAVIKNLILTGIIEAFRAQTPGKVTNQAFFNTASVLISLNIQRYYIPSVVLPGFIQTVIMPAVVNNFAFI